MNRRMVWIRINNSPTKY